MEDEKFTFIDLFSGSGGLSLGFERLSGLPFKSVWANDFNKFAAESYRRNFNCRCLEGDIVDYLEAPNNYVPEADLVVGGPPCQGFSLLNKQRTDDPRKKLWIPFIQIVERSGAQAFVMENVPQLLGSLEYYEIVEWANNRGFKIWSDVLLAADYGVPQLRRRAFIIGSRHAEPENYFPPIKTHFNPDKKPGQLAMFNGEYSHNARPWKTVRDAIADLPAPEGTEIKNIDPPLDLHFKRNPTQKSIDRYKAIPEEGMNRFDLQKNAPEITPDCWIRKKSGGTDLFGRLWWDRPAFTIRTEFFKPEKGRYLHPEQHRPITHREAARFQTYPDDFVFYGSKIEIAKQIGNSVPPVLASHIAQALYSMLNGEERNKQNGHFLGKEAARDHVSSQEQEYET